MSLHQSEEPWTGQDHLASVVHAGRFYPLFEHKVMFTSVAKNACTSIKWMLAGLAGERSDDFRPTTGFEPARASGIHQRHVWRGVPRLRELSPEQRTDIHPDNGWFVFGVTRDPRTRMFSAWQSKYLVANPATLRRPHRRVLSPRVPRTVEDVIEDFATFVEAYAADPRQAAFAGDTHFRPQTALLAADRVPYTRIYDVAEMDQLLADLNKHLSERGHDRDLALGSFNDTPLPANAAVFDSGVRELIEKAYAIDFERFGDRWDFTRIESRATPWTDEALAHVRSLVAAHERVHDLVQIARELERANRRLKRQNERLRRGTSRRRPTPPAS